MNPLELTVYLVKVTIFLDLMVSTKICIFCHHFQAFFQLQNWLDFGFLCHLTE
jgi:hypothetical protein